MTQDAQPQYAQPTAQTQYAQPQYAQRQYAAEPTAQTQYAEPQYAQRQYAADDWYLPKCPVCGLESGLFACSVTCLLLFGPSTVRRSDF